MKKKSIKRLLAIAIAGAMVFSLAACGSEEKTEEKAEEKEEKEEEKAEEDEEKAEEDLEEGKDEKAEKEEEKAEKEEEKEEKTEEKAEEKEEKEEEKEEKKEAKAPEDTLIGIAMPTKSLERWNRDGEYLREQFEDAGYQVEVTYSDNDSDQQNNDIENLIADDVDILIVAAIDGDTLSNTLAEASSNGIPVISYDRLIMNTDSIEYYVSFDNYEVGVLQAEFLIDALDLDADDGNTYNFEFVAGDPADNNATFFFAGEMDTLEPYIDSGKVNVPSGRITFEQCATDAWSTDTAMENMQNVLASYYSDGTQLDAVVASNDSTAAGVAQALVTDYAGTNDVIVTGQDGDIINLQNIVDGLQTMTVYKNVSDEAGVTIVLAESILSGEEPGEELLADFAVDAAYDTESYDNGTGIIPSYLLVPWVVTTDNLDQLVDTGLYEWDGDYLASTATD